MVNASCIPKDRFHEWIAIELSCVVCKELHDIIGSVTDRLVARFDGQILTIQAVSGVVEVTQE